MSPEAIFWTTLTTLFSGVFVAMSKVVVQKNLNPNLNTVLSYGISLFGMLCLFFGTNAQIPDNYTTIILLAFAGGVIYGVSFLTRMESLRYIDSVIFFPINKILGPILVVSGSILMFGEALTSMQIFGVLLSICVPLLLISKQEKHRQNHLYLGIILLIISTFASALNLMFPKTALNFINSLSFYYVWQYFATLLFALLYYVYCEYKNPTRHTITKHEINVGLFTGVFSFLTAYTWMRAQDIFVIS
jgi:drug/metabolite transporter (DMT)-like permease